MMKVDYILFCDTGFSSPFSGTFFQFHFDLGHQVYHPKTFSSPFSGTFFSIC